MLIYVYVHLLPLEKELFLFFFFFSFLFCFPFRLKYFSIHITLLKEAGRQNLEHSFLSIQTSTSVRPTPITVMSKLSVIPLRDRLIAHAALDTLEIE